MRKLRASGGGSSGVVPLPGWDHTYEIFEDYVLAPTRYVVDGTLGGGKGWKGKAAVRPTYARQIVAEDSLSSYGADVEVNGLTGGEGWAAAWEAPTTTIPLGSTLVGQPTTRAKDVLTGAEAAVDPTAATMAAWVWLPEVGTATNIIGRTDSTAAASSPFLYHDGTSFTAFVYDGGNKYVTDPSAISVRTWYHVALTFANSGFLRLYVNGVSVGSPAAVGTHWTGGDRWRLFEANTIATGHFAGMVADLAIWTAELTPAEVAQLATGTRNVPPTIQEGSLLCFFPFDTLADGAASAWNTALWEEVGLVTQAVKGRVVGRLVNLT